MSFVGNFLWFIFGGGFFLGLSWFFIGLLWCCTIIGIPLGICCFRIASFAFLPFGKELVPAEIIGEKAVFGSGFVNVIWVIFSGFWLALAHILAGIGQCCTIIFIPFGLANFKIAKASFAPLGKRIVPTEMAQAAYAAFAQRKLDMALGAVAPQTAAAPQVVAAPQVAAAPQAAAVPPAAAMPENGQSQQ